MEPIKPNQITLKAYAKINLSLDVIRKRADGYHEVCMVMQQIDLWDTVTVTVGNHGKRTEITTNLNYLPADENNTAYQAAELIRSKAVSQSQKDCSVTIHIEKKIPVASGMAGGSADGAAVLHALNKLWQLSLTMEELMALGGEIGADVPFCILGQGALEPKLELSGATCALACGIGTDLTPLPRLNAWVLVSKPPASVSTAFVYKNLRLEEILRHPDTQELVQGLKEKNLHKISRNMVNVLETVSLKEYPIIVYTKNRIEEMAVPARVLMSGSGPTVFAIFSVKKKAKMAYHSMKEINRDTFLVKTV